MQNRTKKIAIISAFAVVAVTCLTLVIVGIRSHDEGALLKVCWENGIAKYVDGAEVNNGSCERPQELVWPKEQIPLAVATIDSQGEDVGLTEEYRQAVQAALLDANLQLGFVLFRTADSVHDSSVVVQIGRASDAMVARRDEQPLAFATHHFVHNKLRCSVGIFSTTGSLRMDYLAAHHELLHCAGLSHDVYNEQSAMYPLTEDDTLSSLRAARITDSDRKLLNKLYKEVKEGGEIRESWTMD